MKFLKKLIKYKKLLFIKHKSEMKIIKKKFQEYFLTIISLKKKKKNKNKIIQKNDLNK